MRHIVVGTRNNPSALAAARKLVATLKEEWPETNFRLMGQSNGSPLDAALLAKRIDIAIHQLEHMPLEQTDGVDLAAIAKRFEARYAFLGRNQQRSLEGLASGTSLGVTCTQSLAQLQHLRPDLNLVRLEGDEEEQLEAFSSSNLGGLLLSAATLLHLEMRSRIGELVAPELLLPPAGQGGLGLTVRDDDDAARELAYSLQHHPSDDRTTSERAVLEGLGLGVLQNPELSVGALANISDDGHLRLDACLVKNGKLTRDHISGKASDSEDLGFSLAEKLLIQK